MKAVVTINGSKYREIKFKNSTSARQWADERIDDYAYEYDGDVTERSPDSYVMVSETTTVAIELKK